MKVRDLVDHVVKLKGQGLNRDEGVLYGDPQAKVKGVLLTWMATVDALKAAKKQGCNVVLCHEAFYLIPQGQGGLTAQNMAWATNRNRLAAAAAGGITVLRVHGSLDMICIWDDFVAALGVENPTPGTGWNKVLSIPPTTVGELVKRVKRVFGLKHVRVAGDLRKRVKTAGFPWGGLGLDSNIGYQARCIELGADVLIAGECDEYGMVFATDAGVPIIETGHSVSENLGIKNFAHRLRKDFPGLKTVYFPKTRVFEYR